MHSTEPVGLRSHWSEHDDSDDQSINHRPTSPASMAPSPPTFKPIRFSIQSTGLLPVTKPKQNDFRMRRSSTPANSHGTQKPPKAQDSVENRPDVVAVTVQDANHSSSSFTSHENHSRGPSADSRSALPKKRGSLLLAASGALGLRFGRKRKSLHRLPVPIVLPDVIEITALRRDEEVEERERLRDAAAQSIGLDPVLMSTEDTIKESDEEPLVEVVEDSATSDSMHIGGRSSLDTSLPDPLIMQPLGEPLRRNSQQTHSRSNSVVIPSFPSSPSNLTELMQMSSTLPKYYPPTSLRIFSLSKHWKSRFFILSSPPPSSSRGPAVSYLHLFKSSGAEEKELERLEINEDSVVFVAEEEVGSRRSVVKVGGVDVGALKKELNHEERAQVMWFLQIVDPFEAQKWIALIKNAILGQRSLRAGLGIPVSTSGTVEPRGDMDVMLTMRAQGMVTSPIPTKPLFSNFSSSRSLPSPIPHPFASPNQNYASSISSNSSRSHAPSPKPPIGAVSTLKGLFTGVGRPRSPSRAASIDEGPEREANEDSFGRMGSNLLNMMRNSNGPLEVPPLSPRLVATQPTTPTSEFPVSGVLSEQRLDRRIFTEHGQLPPGELSSKSSRTLSVGSLSLQPAPRKRSWVIGLPSSTPDQSAMYNHSGGNGSVAGSFGLSHEGPITPPLALMPPLSGLPSHAPEQKARAPSVRSVSTFASGENGSSMDRSSSSTKTRRWSRQGSLPKRSTPPNGPLPSAPVAQPRSDHPYSPEDGGNAWQSSSSIRSATTQVSGLPSFSKRGSNSSGLSSNGSALQLHANGHSASGSSSSHRVSMPPPRPVPTFAPPPVPDQDDSLTPLKVVPAATKSSKRDSVAHRAFRLSLNAPKPPPTAILPPRPDDPEYQAHGRVSTSSTNTQSSGLYSIPASPIPAVSPLPPPTYPLPPTPSSPTRSTSLKQRLRILSAPAQPTSFSMSENGVRPPIRPLPSTLSMNPPPPAETYSPPATPIGERITHLQNDPSFLLLHSPLTPTPTDVKVSRILPPPPEQNGGVPELASLPPPPRRGSKQFSIIDKNVVESLPNTLEVVQHEDKLISLSQQGSVISLGIVSM